MDDQEILAEVARLIREDKLQPTWVSEDGRMAYAGTNGEIILEILVKVA